MIPQRPYQMCTRCIMDTSDPEIVFDEHGVCNHCHQYDDAVSRQPHSTAEREAALAQLVAAIKAQGQDYDCVIGVSGGVDSTYLGYCAKKLGLRPLAVHMDNGWDSELAVSNIEKTLKLLDIDLYTWVLDWEEFKDLQVAFLKASVSDAEIPTDHAIWSVLYKTAARHNVGFILLGTNVATEAVLPSSWTFGIQDWRYIHGIHQRFGSRSLKTFPHINFWESRYYYPRLKHIQVVSFLDYIDYDKQEALRVLEQELGWRPYGGKHYESIYTRFFQGYILPRKFNIDKRRAHLSNLILSGQVSREQALTEIGYPPYAGYMLEEDMEYVLKKFGFSEQEFERIMALPRKTYRDYPNSLRWAQLIRRWQLGRWARRLRLLPRQAGV